DHVLEADEVHDDEVVQVYPGDLLDGLPLTAHTAEGHRRVDHAVVRGHALVFLDRFACRQIHHQVTRQVDQGRGLVVDVDARYEHGVGALTFGFSVVGVLSRALVGTDEKNVHHALDIGGTIPFVGVHLGGGDVSDDALIPPVAEQARDDGQRSEDGGDPLTEGETRRAEIGACSSHAELSRGETGEGVGAGRPVDHT